MFFALLKSKTIWAAIVAIAGAGAGFASGNLSGADAFQTAVTGALGAFLRMGIGFK